MLTVIIQLTTVANENVVSDHVVLFAIRYPLENNSLLNKRLFFSSPLSAIRWFVAQPFGGIPHTQRTMRVHFSSKQMIIF